MRSVVYAAGQYAIQKVPELRALAMVNVANQDLGDTKENGDRAK